MKIILLLFMLFLVGCGDITEDPTLHNPIGQVVYLNFSGVTLRVSDWEDDATKNISSAARRYTNESFVTFESYDNFEGRDLILTYLEEIFFPYNISFVVERPRSHEHITEYSMVVISFKDMSLLGWSNIDCGNRNKKNVSFMHKAGYNTSPYKIAVVVAHEIGHAVGLWHDTGDNSIMNTNKVGNLFIVAPYVDQRVGTRCTKTDLQDAPTILEKNLGLRK